MQGDRIAPLDIGMIDEGVDLAGASVSIALGLQAKTHLDGFRDVVFVGEVDAAELE